MKRIILLCLMLAAVSVSAHAEVSIETAVSRSSLPVGDQLTLDIIITNAEGRIEKPVINSIEGFTSYSQGHSQEFSIINGRSSSRSIYSYVLVANSTGAKTIGPFAVVIAGKEYKVAPVKVEVTQSGVTQGGYTWAQGPVSTPSPRSMPSGAKVGEQDIFVKAWLDKDEVYLNEPVMLTFTLFTRLSATYKGFEKEPVTTGFWVEDFPPEKTIRRTEQFLNGQRYVVADVRKMALFPTSVGAFTIDPGTLSATVEVHGDDGFQTFFSSNIFGGRRSGGFPQGFTTEMVNKVLPSDPVRLIVKALPENGKPKTFSGAVGQFEIESSIDKNDVEVGDPVTLKVKIAGRGNINTLQTPKLPVMDAFKVYDSSSSTHISKERLVVEGDKVTETVIVPKRPGVYEIPSTTFTYFDVNAGEYRTLKTEAHRLTVRGTATVEEPASRTDPASSAEDLLEPADKADVDFVAKDIRYIKTADSGRPRPRAGSLTDPLYWGLNLVLLGLCGFFTWLSTRGGSGLMDAKGHRLRRSHSAARAKLRQSAVWMKQGKQNEFYAEISRAVHGYFADKFDVPAQAISTHRIEELAGEIVSAELLNKIKKLFDEMSSGRFAKDTKDAEHMSDVYDQADAVISAFEKVRIKK